MVVLIRKRIKNETRYKIRPTHFGLVYISLNSFAFRTNSLPFSTCSTNSPNCRGILYARQISQNNSGLSTYGINVPSHMITYITPINASVKYHFHICGLSKLSCPLFICVDDYECDIENFFAVIRPHQQHIITSETQKNSNGSHAMAQYKLQSVKKKHQTKYTILKVKCSTMDT